MMGGPDGGVASTRHLKTALLGRRGTDSQGTNARVLRAPEVGAVTLAGSPCPPRERMFCTTFLPAPSEELSDCGSNPIGCLAQLCCLVLPQDELYMPLAVYTSKLSIGQGDCTHIPLEGLLLDVNLVSTKVEDDGFNLSKASDASMAGRSTLRAEPKGCCGIRSRCELCCWELGVWSGVIPLRISP